MSGFELRVQVTEDVRARLAGLLPRAVEMSVRQLGIMVKDQIQLNVTNRVLKVRSGKLRSTWAANPQVSGSGESTTATITSHGLAYAAIHEFGGTVRARSGKLAIPLDAMRTPAGASRATARQVIANPQAYGYADTFYAKGVIFGKLGKTGSGRQRTKLALRGPGRGQEGPAQRVRTAIVPLFALKESVTIPARHYVSLALEQAQARGQGVVESVMAKVIRDSGGGE